MSVDRALKTGRIYLWVPRAWIVDIHYLAEGFEGLLVATTRDRNTGLVQLTVAPEQEDVAAQVVETILANYQGTKLADGIT